MLRVVLQRLRRLDCLLLLGVLLAIVGAKLELVRVYGSDLPFWDQWDAEGEGVYIAAGRGALTASTFFKPHNEHRIVFTKLLAFGLERLNGQWDARLEMTVNVFIHLGALAALLLALKSQVHRISWRLGCLVAGVLFALPFAWENTLGGFQSQFYFLVLFSTLHLAGTFGLYKPGSTWSAQFAGLCAVFSMASGFFSALAVVLILGLQAVRLRSCSRREGSLLAINAALVALGALLHVAPPEQSIFHVQSAGQFVTALSAILAWPSSAVYFCWLGLLPLAFVFTNRLRSGSPFARTYLLPALIAWWSLQILATVIARGNSVVLSSRYFDTFSFGTVLIAVSWSESLAARNTNVRLKSALGLLAGVWVTLLLVGSVAQWKDTQDNYLRQMPSLNEQREATVRDFVAHHADSFSEAKPFTEIPYPNAERLGLLLSDPAIEPILPPSVRWQTGLTREFPVVRAAAEAVLSSGRVLFILGAALQLGVLGSLTAGWLKSVRTAAPSTSRSTLG